MTARPFPGAVAAALSDPLSERASAADTRAVAQEPAARARALRHVARHGVQIAARRAGVSAQAAVHDEPLKQRPDPAPAAL
jgi:hypothetical protein